MYLKNNPAFKKIFLTVNILFCVFNNSISAQELSAGKISSAELTPYDTCVLSKTSDAEDDVLASDISSICKIQTQSSDSINTSAEQRSAIDTRINIEMSNTYKPFTLMAFKPNFILPISYNHTGYDSSLYPDQPNGETTTFDDFETQFQISIKTPLATEIFNRHISLFAGYTNRSFWQVYNNDISRPFRETNHEPELWLQSVSRIDIMGFSNRVIGLGLSHQSNGRSADLSRSWNRIYTNFAFEKQSFVFTLKLWSRFDESPLTDDNPDITYYMGHGEFRVLYKKNNNTFALMSRNNIESGFDRGATELSWSFSIGHRKDMRGYIQIFSGYGESLIDYNQSVNRIGFGISLSDWL